MKNSKFYNKIFKKEPSNKTWLTKLLLCIILLLSSLIYVNINKENKQKYINNIFEDTISFNKMNKIYNKFIGDINILDNKQKDIMTINEELNYESITQYNNSTEIKLKENEIINVLKPGIIVYIGDKEDLGNTIIVQGNDGVDIWYSNITTTEYTLYDYVKKGDILGTLNNEYLYLTIKKDDKYLTYEEYFK